MKKLLTVVAAGLAASLASANATTFQFKGDGGAYDSPTANFAFDCGSVGTDFCSDDDSLGLSYSKDGIDFTATGYAGGDAAQLIQDIQPDNSGLGVLSEMDAAQDQTQFDSGEWIEFVFTDEVYLSNIEFNAGNDTDCSSPGSEGPCGDFNLFIDGMFYATITADDLLTDVFVGTSFAFVAITEAAGFVIAQFDVSDVPVPAALPLLLSGLAGLGFASRRKKTA